MYHLPCIYCALVPKICVRHKMLHVFWYIDVLTCMITHRLNSKDNWTLELVVVCHEYYRQGQVGECADTWCKRIQPTERAQLLLPGNLPTRLCESEMTNGLTVLLFCDVHISYIVRCDTELNTVPGCCLWI